MYSCWFSILSSVWQGDILSPIFFTLHRDPLIIQLQHLELGCSIHGEFFGCLMYADDTLLMSHTVHSVQMMFHVCDELDTQQTCMPPGKLNKTKSQ